ncbi:hypothetical protein [Stenotrophomonas sp. SY1]|jgi:hypothetical protein|uniref:hypothetical protein n=1 Tax=Stenotrophomonas sp. SY1 TaxID=477235 RepID=UPI001E47A72A|nr:hypothetical protein [Stenotrophomonas sp. SY1]MCD9088262.1 hypothetical protein [Stenotrophomonas sp. SY1]
MGTQNHPNQNKQDQTRQGRPGVDDARKGNPSRQASRGEPSHQKDMQDRDAPQKDRMDPKH